MFDDNKKIGIGLCAIGLICMGLGVLLFFDRALLSLGDMAFIMGLCFLLGPSKTGKFFFRKEKWQGTSGFFGGFLLIIYGWAFFGFIGQCYGIWKLFAAFLPNVVASLKMVPGIGPLLNVWPLSLLCGKIYDNRRLPV